MKTNFEGVFTALVTPFKKGEVDFSSLKKLLAHQLQNGIQGFVVSGSTGEAATLSLDEKLKVLDFVRGEVSGRVPVIMGSGTFNTRESCELAQKFEKAKADALLVVTPYYNKPPQRGLIEHFKKICQSTKLPVIAYNVPSRTALSMDVETVAAIAKACPSLVGIKEAAGKLEVIADLKKALPKDFLVTSGDDGTFVEAMHLGAQGVISVVSHVVPRLCVDASRISKNAKEVKIFTDELKEISEVIFCESNPIPVKWALCKMGIIDSAEVRLQLVELAERFYGPLTQALKNRGVL
jgi:4-hydroxy-tetrahydrodipicolinate synthase